MINTGDLVSTAEAAQILGKSIRTIHRMARDGDLEAIKLGTTTRAWVFERSKLVELAHKQAAA